jgi:hypothetical protein
VVLGCSLSIGRSKRVTEMLGGMIEIEHLVAAWQRLAEITPVVWRPIGYFDDP